MPILKSILLTVLSCFWFCGFSQYVPNYPHFDHLYAQADSAYTAKNFPLSASFYEEAMSLPENQKPEMYGLAFYKMACVYSLLKEKDKALFYLEKSFSVRYSKTGETPVTAIWIGSDSDLDFIRNELSFTNLLKKYYSSKEMEYYEKSSAFNSKKEISYKMLLDYLHTFDSLVTQTRSIRISNKTIYWQKKGEEYIYNNTFLPMPDASILKNNDLVIIDCIFKLNFIWWNGESEKDKQPFPYFSISVYNSNFTGRFSLYGLQFKEPMTFVKCTFDKNFQILFTNLDPLNPLTNIGSQLNKLTIEDCSFHFGWLTLSTTQPIDIFLTGNVSKDSSDFSIKCNNVHLAKIYGNNLMQNNLNVQLDEVDYLNVDNNRFNNILINQTNVKNEFNLSGTRVNGMFVLSKSLAETVNNIDWTTVDSLHLGLLQTDNLMQGGGVPEQGRMNAETKRTPFDYISGKTTGDISNPKSFRQLMALYSMFINAYKSKNDIESYNRCFIMVKELQSKRLKYLYESNKTFEAYFRWKLSQLLKFYVRYGTDPARAITISLYIIFWFGVFFFFFPSDWDVTSKTRLLENFKSFIQKNEKGYVVPFFVLTGGFALSLINALTLSLNAFITLGFGNIPTHGLARYICVIEGFMGWFLLSIFTVALINQVL